MIKKISHALAAVILVFSFIPSLSLKYETNNLNLGTVHFDKAEGSDTKFFKVALDAALEQNDLQIDAKIVDNKKESNEVPLIIISTVRLFMLIF